MPNEALDFLHTLFTSCTTGHLTLTAIHPDGQHATPSRHIPLHNDLALHTALADLHRANQAGWGVFFGVATRQHNLGRWRRGGQADLLELPALFVDIDLPPREALPRLQANSPPPSILVGSGGGLHAYWLLSEPTSAWTQAKQALQHLQQRLAADHSSLAQSLRLPGSTNTKPNRHHASCELLALQTMRYPLEVFLPPPANSAAQPRLNLPRVTPTTARRPFNPRVITAVELALQRDYGGYWQRNGWLGACCPCGHEHDAPGRHFAFNPHKAVGVCLGKHGTLSLTDLCDRLQINSADYGGLYRT
jgi:hypothetical protein